MDAAVDHGVGGYGHGNRRGDAFQAMVSGLVEQVADAHGGSSFSREVDGQAGGAAGKQASDGIQLFSAALQVGAGDGKIGGVHSGDAGEKQLIFPVPELVRLRRFRKGRTWSDRGFGSVGGRFRSGGFFSAGNSAQRRGN